MYSNAKLTHLLHKWSCHFWRLFKNRKQQHALYSPKGDCFWKKIPPNQKIVVRSKQSKQWWWVTMYNQKHAWDEQLPVVSIVSVHCFPKYCLYYGGGLGGWIKRIQLCKMNMGHNPPISAAPPIFHLQLIFSICLFGELSLVRILCSAIRHSATFTSKHLLHTLAVHRLRIVETFLSRFSLLQDGHRRIHFSHGVQLLSNLFHFCTSLISQFCSVWWPMSV